jgi:dienelactone hydrolase
MRKLIAKHLVLVLSLLASSSAWALDSFTDSYKAGRTNYSIDGREPSASGTYPVFVYMVGTWEDHQNASAIAAIEGMASRGYVAATVDYSNSSFGGCSTISSRAKYIFDAMSSSSAIRKLCGRAKADCGKGVVVGGFSQGSIIAILAKNYDGRVAAAYALGAGVQYDSYDLRSCVADGNRTLTSDRLRAVNGEADGFMGGNADSVRAQLEELTGLSCGGTAYSCFRSNDSGWYMVTHGEVDDGNAEHCYMRNGDCGFGNQNRLDKNWQTGTMPGSLNPNLDWLTNFTR